MPCESVPCVLSHYVSGNQYDQFLESTPLGWGSMLIQKYQRWFITFHTLCYHHIKNNWLKVQYIPLNMHIAVMCFVLLCFYYHSLEINVIHISKFFRVASLALGQSYDCPSASEAIPKNLGRNNWCRTTRKHNELQTLCKILGMYCKDIDAFGIKTSVDKSNIQYIFFWITHTVQDYHQTLWLPHALAPGRLLHSPHEVAARLSVHMVGFILPCMPFAGLNKMGITIITVDSG